MVDFVIPRFDTGDVEFRCDKDEIMIYGTPKGPVRLAELCLKLVNRRGDESTDHIHLEDYELLTQDSLRGVLAVFQ
jgi:hypothetical protein